MSPRRIGLGKGLESLIPLVEEEEVEISIRLAQHRLDHLSDPALVVVDVGHDADRWTAARCFSSHDGDRSPLPRVP